MDPVVQGIINGFLKNYKVISKDKKDIMLKWEEPFEIQGLPLHNFKRVAAIGDGNCMLHSFLFATSAIYRSHDNEMRGYLANEWRKQLMDKTEELNKEADLFYADSGGRVIIQETLDELLPEEYTELGIEIGAIIARIYGHNWLALRLDKTGALHPVRQSYNNFDSAKPTIVIHYLGEVLILVKAIKDSALAGILKLSFIQRYLLQILLSFPKKLPINQSQNERQQRNQKINL